jgi:hypothetical protein
VDGTSPSAGTDSGLSEALRFDGMASAVPSGVDYAASGLPWHRRRRWRRTLLVLGALTCAAAAFWLGPPVGRHVTLLRLQRRCMAYSQLAGHVAYDAHAEQAEALPNADARYQLMLDPKRYAVSMPDVGYVVPEWQDLYAAISPPGMKPAATLFLHERRNRRGEARLVAVHSVPAFVGYHRASHLSIRTVRPGTLLARPVLLWETTSLTSVGDPVGDAERIITGRADPSDDSHFTFEIESMGERDTIDGWLRDDDSVVLEFRQRASSVTPPPPASPASLPSGGPAGAGPASRGGR